MKKYKKFINKYNNILTEDYDFFVQAEPFYAETRDEFIEKAFELYYILGFLEDINDLDTLTNKTKENLISGREILGVDWKGKGFYDLIDWWTGSYNNYIWNTEDIIHRKGSNFKEVVKFNFFYFMLHFNYKML